MRSSFFAGVTTILLTAAPLWATPINGSASFLPGAINVTFSSPSVPSDAPITNQYAAFGVTFSGAVKGDVGNIGIPNQDGNTIQNFISDGPVLQPTFINFAAPQTAADFSLAAQPGTATITSFLAGNPVESFVATTSIFGTNNIYGFTNSLFDSVRIVISSSDNADIIDNIQFQHTPEPNSLVLLGFATCAGLCFYGRRGK
jgi:hypothetical protein